MVSMHFSRAMAFMQFSGLWRLRNLRLLPRLSAIRIGSAYVSPICKFSKSSGPVRYIPQSSRSQGARKQSSLETQTQNTDNGALGIEREEMDRASESMQQVWERSVQAVRDFDSFFSRSAEMHDDEFAKDEEEGPEWSRSLPNTEQICVQKAQADNALAPLRLSEPTSTAAMQRFVHKAAKAQKATPVKKTESENLGSPKAIAELSSVKSVHHAPNETQIEETFLSDDDEPMLDEREIESLYEESGVAGTFELEDEFHDIAYSSGSRLAKCFQSTRLKQAETASTAAQEDAKNQAIRYLAMRPYTAFQLRNKLLGRKISPELVDYAISVVQNCGLQCDIAYAETYARSRWNNNSWGPQRIKQGLKQRGISDEIAKIAICRVFQEEQDESDHLEPKLGMSKAAMDQLFLQASKQFARGRNISDDTRVRRMIGWLQYRGYNYRVIAAVLKDLLKKSSVNET